MNTIAAQAPVNTQAYRFGALDARLGEVACPEMYFRNADDKADYCRGHESVAGRSITTVQILGGNRS